MILEYMRLRGAKGIYSGIHQEDIEIDFSQFGPGLVLVQGPTGCGKTTLVENLSPFLLLPSHTGKLSNHFFLADSCRELRMMMGNDHYRILLEINAKTGKVKSVIFKNGEALNPDGNATSYNEQVFRLFGQPKIFFSSLFMPQKRPSFDGLEPKDAKILLLKLIGADHLQNKCEHARKKATSLDDRITSLRTSISSKTVELESLISLDADISELRNLISKYEGDIAEANTAIPQLAAQIEQLRTRATAQAVIKSQITDAANRLASIQGAVTEFTVAFERENGPRIAQLNAAIETNKAAAAALRPQTSEEKLTRIETRIKEADRAKQLYGETLQERQAYDALQIKLQEALSAYSTAKSAHIQRESTLKSDLATAQTNLRVASSEYDASHHSLVTDVTLKEAAVANLSSIPCQQLEEATARACEDCRFIRGAIHNRNELPDLVARLARMPEEWAEREKSLTTAVNTAQSALDTHGVWVGSPEEKQLVAAGQEIREQIAELKFDTAAADKAKQEYDKFERENPYQVKQSLLQKKAELELLDHRIESDQKSLDELTASKASRLDEFSPQRAAAIQEITALNENIDPSVDSALADAVALLDTKRATLHSAGIDLAKQKMSLESKLADLARRQSLETERTAEQEELARLLSDQADWIDLDESLSRNGGFQSMMVDSAGVQMAPYMDQMFRHYGRDWTIQIQTSFPTADGKEMRDGFRVIINRPEGPEELGDLSGGEECIADQVIYDAITDMLRRRSGLILQTAIRDEAGDGLDEELGAEYLRAIEAAHSLSGVYQTLLIVHRAALQQLFTQCILLDPKSSEGLTVRIS